MTLDETIHRLRQVAERAGGELRLLDVSAKCRAVVDRARWSIQAEAELAIRDILDLCGAGQSAALRFDAEPGRDYFIERAARGEGHPIGWSRRR